MNVERKLISRSKFRELDGQVSAMTVWRRERTVPSYPKPVMIRKRAFYWSDEVDQYFASLASQYAVAVQTERPTPLKRRAAQP